MLARLIAQSGFSASIGGATIIYIATDIQTVNVADHRGTIIFGARRDRGGNVIMPLKVEKMLRVVQ